MRPKHIYGFAYFNEEEPSVRYRAQAPLQYLEAEWGVTHSAFYPGSHRKGLLRFLKIGCEVAFFRRRQSVIVFQKIYTTGMYAQALKLLLRLQPRHTLYDIDDAEWCRRPAETIHYFLKHCTVCAAGSQALLSYIKPHNKAAFLLTSPVINHGVVRAPLPSQKPFTIGWIGYWTGHRESLRQLLFSALEQLPFAARLVLLGVRNETEKAQVTEDLRNCKNITVETPLAIDWQNENFVFSPIAQFDVGVSPLLDTGFNRAKSAFKLKQCLSCGVPVLGSPVGENKTFLEDGVNGYLCAGPEDFLAKLLLFQELPQAEKARLQNGALATVPRFSVAHFCNTFMDYFAGR